MFKATSPIWIAKNHEGNFQPDSGEQALIITPASNYLASRRMNARHEVKA